MPHFPFYFATFVIVLGAIYCQDTGYNLYTYETNSTKKTLEYYMEDEDEIYYHPWRSDYLEDEVDVEFVPLKYNVLEEEGLSLYDEDNRRRSVDDVLGHFTRLNDSYMILAPIIARPSTVYRVVVLPFRTEEYNQDIELRATLSSTKGEELSYALGKAMNGYSSELMMKLPDALPGPFLRLRVTGHQGPNILFVNSTVVHPSNDFLTIVVSMSKPAYTGGQNVQFRVGLMINSMLPYQEPVDVYILDPNGYVTRRWISRVPNIGLLDLRFDAPQLPVPGFWRIRIKAKTQVKDHPFLIVKYYVPRFEVMFDVMPFFLSTDEVIKGAIWGYVTSDALVYGNVTSTLWVKYPATADDSWYKQIGEPRQAYMKDGVYEFEIPMSEFTGYVPSLPGTEVKVTVVVQDSFTGTVTSGYFKTRIISGDISVNFLGQDPVIFRPGMPLTLSVNVAYDDYNSLDPEILAKSSLRITASASGGSSGVIPQIFIPPENEEGSEDEAYMELRKAYEHNITGLYNDEENYIHRVQFESLLAREAYILKSKFDEFRKTGIFTFTIDVPKNSIALTVNAVFSNEEGVQTAAARLEGRSNYHPKDKHLHVTSSTENAVVGEFAVFHVRTNFPLKKFHYVIMSKGILLHSATEEVPFAGAEGVATLGIAMSKEMFPTMTFVAYHVDMYGDLSSDYIIIPVKYPNFMEAELFINQHKDHSKRTVEGFAISLPGSMMSISCSRPLNYMLHPRSRLTQAKVAMEALKLELFQRTVSRTHRMPRNSADPATVHFVTSGDTEGESVRTLQSSGLSTLSDSRFKTSSLSVGNCEISLGLLECGDGTCFHYGDVCNHFRDCADGRDELHCQYQFFPNRTHNEGMEELELYHLFRFSWWKDLFEGDQDWAWKTTFIGHGRDEDLGLIVPWTQDDWILDTFALHSEFGFAVLDPVTYSSDPPLFIILEGPAVCRRGEQISIRTTIFNSMYYDLLVLLTLTHSEDYHFIHVEEKGVVDAYNPRTSSGDHQHLVLMHSRETKDVFLPIAVLLQKGTLKVTVRMTSQLAWDEATHSVEIKPEGAPVYKHTSVLLDLKSRALFYEFLNIPIDESPEISLTIFRRFVYGSPEAKLTLSGDVFGPISEDFSVSHENAFNGRHMKSTDGLAFNFGATLWTLHYLRLTNQLNTSEALYAFEFMNVQMAGMLTRFRDGGFKMWHYSGPSVWLTAHVVNMLKSAMFEDWEYLIYVDPRVLTDAAKFMLQHQNPEGDFFENELCNVTLDSKYNYKKNYGRNVSIGITAYVTATLQEILPMLSGQTRANSIQSIWSAMRFLERSLPSLTDSYDIAITTWALSITGSSEKEVAVSKLLVKMRQQDGFRYWSKSKMTIHKRIRENNQKPFLMPKEPQEWDSHAIEATSYALLVLLNREGVTPRQEKIVNWLIAVRDWDYAFSATSDSVIALKALTEYCYRARLRDVTDLTVEVEATSTRLKFQNQIRIEQPFVAMIQKVEVPNPWGHLEITGRGSGQALLQMTTTWGVDLTTYLEKPPREYFSLVVKEYHHQPRNKSRITTTVCTQWLATDISPTSHSAMVEIEVPSGYSAYQPDLNRGVKIAKKRQFPEIADAYISNSYIFFQFNYIPPNEQCFTYDLHRWHPVANLTFIRSAMVFELYAPEHFEQIIINSTTLSALDICEVCGSYQCPYCFYYSAGNLVEKSILITLCVVALVFNELVYHFWSQKLAVTFFI